MDRRNLSISMVTVLNMWLLLLACAMCVSAGILPKQGCQHGECADDGTQYGDSMNMNIPMNGKTVTLNLKKSDVINASLPVYLGTDKYAFSRWQGGKEEDFVVYEDTDRAASFLMWTEVQNGGASRGMRGIFQDGDNMYQLEPKPTRQQAHDPIPGGGGPEDSVVVTVNDMDLSMTKVDTTVTASEAEQRVTKDTEQTSQQVQDYMQKIQEQGHAFPKYYYEVELFLVVDYAVFDQWVHKSSQYHYSDREADAINNIRFHFAHVMHGISQRYRDVEDHNMRITIRPVGIYIAKTRSASYWTEGYGIKEPPRYSEADKALDAFEEWINREDLKLPSFDQATLYTGNLLFAGYSYVTGTRRTISGLADIQGVCGPKRASINRHRIVHADIQTGAHELGHNLGAYHDGYDNSCQSSDQYIMATSPGNLNDNNRENLHKFSYCSKNDFREYLLFLNNRDENCLRSRDNNDEWYYNHHLSVKPGERFSPDEQCMILFGLQSFYCGGGHHDESLCEAMYCWDPAKRQCLGHHEQRAGDRTQCGNRKWCDQGKCVADSRAPLADDPECIYGDYLDVVDNRQKCYDIGINEPNRCYGERFSEQCCATCKRLERQDQPQCLYGDRNPKYCREQVRSHDCYHDSIRSTCCETCARFHTGKEGCEYGNKASRPRCDRIDRGEDLYKCYTEGDTCCEKCSNPPAGSSPDCEWGDKASWCSSLDIRQCRETRTRDTCCEKCRGYNTNTGTPTSSGQSCSGPDQVSYCNNIVSRHCYSDSNRCCQTCARYFTGHARCEYGDKATWCESYVNKYRERACSSQSVGETCCRSCRPYIAGSGSGESCRDDAGWCSNIFPGACYSASTSRTCCATCKGYDRGSSSTCRYGNKVSWCKTEYCDRESERCCETCRK